MDQSLTGIRGSGDVEVSAVTNPDRYNEPLDTAYKLSPEEATFFKKETGIDNDNDLRTHILKVHKEAYEIFPYASIRWFLFLRLGIATQPEYETIIQLGKERPDEFLLDIGCCFGVDARKAAADGFPLRNIVTTDLMQGFYDMGHALFNTTPESYPISFVHGDVFDPNILRIVPPFDEPPRTERPDLSTVRSLNPLAGRCAVIYASNFFHLFSEDNQHSLAKALAGLLSPQPGSMICGEHVGNWEKGFFYHEIGGRRVGAFQHSLESWRAVWDGDVFPKGSVKVNATLERTGEAATMAYLRLQWSVVRL